MLVEVVELTVVCLRSCFLLRFPLELLHIPSPPLHIHRELRLQEREKHGEGDRGKGVSNGVVGRKEETVSGGAGHPAGVRKGELMVSTSDLLVGVHGAGQLASCEPRMMRRMGCRSSNRRDVATVAPERLLGELSLRAARA